MVLMSDYYLVWALGLRAPDLFSTVFSFSYFLFTAFDQSQHVWHPIVVFGRPFPSRLIDLWCQVLSEPHSIELENVATV